MHVYASAGSNYRWSLLLLIALVAVAPPEVHAEICVTRHAIIDGDPVAVDDVAYTAGGGESVSIPVLANDLVSATGHLSIVSFTQPGLAGAVVTSNGPTLTYRAPAGVPAADLFTYTITDTTRTDSRATGVVRILPRATVTIATERCGGDHGGSCTFVATASTPGDVREYVWESPVPGNPGRSFRGGLRAFFEFVEAGTYPVTVKVYYHSGLYAETTLQQSITFLAQLKWTCQWGGPRHQPVFIGEDEICRTDYLGGGAAVLDFNSLHTFPGGISNLEVAFGLGEAGDRVERVAPPAEYVVGSSCLYSSDACRQIATFKKGGIYSVTAAVRRADLAGRPVVNACGSTQQAPCIFQRLMEITDSAPVAAFTASRIAGTRAFDFDAGPSTDEHMNAASQLYCPECLPRHEWAFGDGTSVEVSPTLVVPEKVRHSFRDVGDYLVTLKLTDYGGQSHARTETVSVTNEPPVPQLNAFCRGLGCQFHGTGTTDDAPQYEVEWAFGDGATGGSFFDEHAYRKQGCYDVTFVVNDADGASASKRKTVAVSNFPLTPTGTPAVDAHASRYVVYDGDTGQPIRRDTNGNLNGILEPGETVLLEPRWSVTPQIELIQTYEAGLSWTVPNSVTATLAAPYARYNTSGGVSDCWTVDLPDSCHVVTLNSDQRTSPHVDLTLTERLASGGAFVQSTIHVGKSFTDIPAGAFYYEAAEALLHRGITAGCGGRQFCPDRVLTRAELAVFLLRAKYGAGYVPPPCNADPYPDVPCAYWASPWIAKVKSDGIMGAAWDSATAQWKANFEPDSGVTRAAIAEPLLRASAGLTSPPACLPANPFTDVSCDSFTGEYPPNTASWIAELKRRGITTGCGGDAYCPAQTLKRDATSVFLVRAFQLKIDHRVCPAGRPVYTTADGSNSTTAAASAAGDIQQ